MPNRLNLFPEENETQNTGQENKPSLLQQLFGIGGIALPEGNKLAIWFLVIVVILFIIFFYFFLNIIDKIVDKALTPEKEKTEIVLQNDYNELLKNAKILQAENQKLKDSMNNLQTTDIEQLQKNTDSLIYRETQPLINRLKK